MMHLRPALIALLLAGCASASAPDPGEDRRNPALTISVTSLRVGEVASLFVTPAGYTHYYVFSCEGPFHVERRDGDLWRSAKDAEACDEKPAFRTLPIAESPELVFAAPGTYRISVLLSAGDDSTERRTLRTEAVTVLP